MNADQGRPVDPIAVAAKLMARIAELTAEVNLWKDRCEAERQAHEATIDHLHKIMNEEP